MALRLVIAEKPKRASKNLKTISVWRFGCNLYFLLFFCCFGC